MNVYLESLADFRLVKIVGEIDSRSVSEVERQILPLAQSQAKVILDMSQVNYLSSAGLRLLLLFHRQCHAGQGCVALTGLKEEIKDTMALTGFLEFFTVYDTVIAAQAALQTQPSPTPADSES